MGAWSSWLVLVCLCIGCHHVVSSLESQDAGGITAFKAQLQNAPSSWSSSDPCSWQGVTCTGTQVTALSFSSMNLKGSSISDIMSLTNLQYIDLSNNPGLSGSLPASVGFLTNMQNLTLLGCGFSGIIPSALGNLVKLVFLDLSSNRFSGSIPPSIGNLVYLYWLDLTNNTLTGTLPVSSVNGVGLDMLKKTKHFHLSLNQLSGSIPSGLFASGMQIIHLLLDGNKLTGSIPDTISLASRLEVLRLDRNSLSGQVPSSINQLASLNSLYLSNNKFNGSVPDLSGLSLLSYVDLSNNSFSPSLAPQWFSKQNLSLTTIIMEYGTLNGPIPAGLFNIPTLEAVRLKSNSFNGTLTLGSSASSNLQFVDLSNNSISNETGNWGKIELLLKDNPVCDQDTTYCKLSSQQIVPYKTTINCGSSTSCSLPNQINPATCQCAYPFGGNMHFRSITFSDISNTTIFSSLETQIWTQTGLPKNYVSISSVYFDENDYLVVPIFLFPSSGTSFNSSGISALSYLFSNNLFKPSKGFGPYYFSAFGYVISATGSTQSGSLNMGGIVGLIIGCLVLVLIIGGLVFYAIKKRKEAIAAKTQSSPFDSWGTTASGTVGDAPKIRGVKWFSFEEVKKCTGNFSARNEVGAGGYGKVYFGKLPNGQAVAIKRLKAGSNQGETEFKTEIELLSRVHHKNLVELVGFCFDRGEKMLIYEFIPNGTLKDCLSGKSGINLDWKSRILIALDSARGLDYLHTLVNPPIIHRDIKSTNILLDEQLIAKVADFGLSKLVSDEDHDKGHVSTVVKGTLGYLDPEYYMTQKLTEKSDVYSFGIVLFELVTARAPIEKNMHIVRVVRSKYDGTKDDYGLRDLVDPLISNEVLYGFGEYMDLALQCVIESADERPTMKDVVRVLEEILQDKELKGKETAVTFTADYRMQAGAAYESNVSSSSIGFTTDSSGYSGMSRFYKKQAQM